MGKPLSEILKKVGITVEDFDKICEKFTNKKIFKVSQDNKLIKDDNENLIKVKYDN